ncbi:hypothetical protein COW99_04845 [Candidatus Roizmanbacteria bacterium CG22_combo_CG10-13_8_21_14_all_38_20]|uniref:Uncharacterized protein n=1 Tax=Candidatus Roizmanbacteria bacterium CG22_combo_CG10-13_8_21_14_all_38_20 TaxID=1974862 RepID=A0A2H0BUG7_9BACT|nr:hypothetical protein [Candidatus Microgenomates bacterium]PIP61312.1 MAG: hypothetical protein COW99_04845 [Candidatus Roizmanbacteria bacterium CG22_combo_CG10-13_8_21_14_all_38_20]PJC30616.1 MAG: hypothetical protein CO050_05900 [Candidatus Roizmanbacteria bacterium CG_4_9_14_0_2_um_filter_38_17]
MIIVIIILLALVSFILAWRSLSELEVPHGIVEQIEKSVRRVKSWGTIIFLRDKRIVYSGKTPKETTEKKNLES